MKIFKNLNFLAISITLIFLVNCTKESNKNQISNNTPSSIVLQKDSYKPFEAVFFKMSSTWKDAPDSIQIGQSYIQISNQDSFLVGLCPNIAPGEYSIKINEQFKFTIKISQPLNIDPEKVYDSLMIISDFNKINSQNEKQINYWQNIIKTEWPKLNSADKHQVSQFLSLNGFLTNETIDQGDLTFLDSLKGRTNFNNLDEAQNRFSIGVVKSKVLIVTGIAAIAVGVYNAHTGLGLVSVGAGCIILYKYKNTLYSILENWKYSCCQFNDFYIIENRNQAFFKNGETLNYSVKANCSNISQIDVSRKDASWLFSNLNTIQSSVNKLNYIINKFLSFLPGVEELDWNPNQYISPTEYKKILPMYFSNISIKNVSNPNIKLTLIEGNNGDIKIKTESDLTDTVNFSFTIQYSSKYGFTPENNTKTFSGKYIPKSILGLWDCMNVKDFDEKKVTNQDCDGVSYQYVSEHVNEKMYFYFSQDSVYYTIKETAKEYTINRPSKCGGQFYTETPLNPVYKFKISKRYANKFELKGELLNGILIFNIIDDKNITFSMTFLSGAGDQTTISNIKCVKK